MVGKLAGYLVRGEDIRGASTRSLQAKKLVVANQWPDFVGAMCEVAISICWDFRHRLLLGDRWLFERNSALILHVPPQPGFVDNESKSLTGLQSGPLF